MIHTRLAPAPARVAHRWAHAIVLALVALVVAVAPTAAAERVRVVALGDSLVAGYGLAPTEALPVQLQAALRARGHTDVDIVDAGLSGDTASGGLDRLDWAVPPESDAVILALGANDALRGIDPEVTKAALDALLSRLTAAKRAVLLVGMRAPRNWGEDYRLRFDAIYPALAEKHRVPLYPFLLEGVALERELNQADGLHPTAKGIAEVVRRILPVVETWLAPVRAARRGG